MNLVGPLSYFSESHRGARDAVDTVGVLILAKGTVVVSGAPVPFSIATGSMHAINDDTWIEVITADS